MSHQLGLNQKQKNKEPFVLSVKKLVPEDLSSLLTTITLLKPHVVYYVVRVIQVLGDFEIGLNY